jgi:hypothetical protein
MTVFWLVIAPIKLKISFFNCLHELTSLTYHYCSLHAKPFKLSNITNIDITPAAFLLQVAVKQVALVVIVTYFDFVSIILFVDIIETVNWVSRET